MWVYVIAPPRITVPIRDTILQIIFGVIPLLYSITSSFMCISGVIFTASPGVPTIDIEAWLEFFGAYPLISSGLLKDGITYSSFPFWVWILFTCLEFASRIGFDRKVSCLTYFYLTRFPTAKSEFQTGFETRSRYSHTPPETAVIVNRERINNLLRSIYVGSNWNPNNITNP